jgi:outer membrane receptor protein involved in Fe transport
MTSGKSFILILFLLFFLITGHTSLAQPTPSRAKGVVMSADPLAPLHLVSLALYQQTDTSLVSGTMTNQHGEFVFDRIRPGSYIMIISFVGFKTESIAVSFGGESHRLPDTIYLHPTAQYLEIVSITGNASDKMIMSDMHSINVARSEGAVTGNLTEILRNTQGITIDPDNTLYLNGNKNILVLVNGRPTTLDAIQSMPVSQVERIEVITNPNVRYDAEGTGGIINIVARAEAARGTSGNVNLNYGLFNRVNGGVNLMRTGKRWSAGLNLSARDETTEVMSQLWRNLLFGDVVIDQEMESKQRSVVRSAAVNIQGKPLSGHVVSGNFRVLLPQQYNQQGINGTASGDSLTTKYLRRNEVSFARTNLEVSLNYKRVFAENKHSLSMDVMHSRIRGSRPADYYLEELYLQRSEGGGAPKLAAVQIDYLKAYSKSGRIEAGVKQTLRWNRFDYRFYERDSIDAAWELDSLFSNDLQHREEISAGYLMLSDTLFSKISVKTGLRLEYSHSLLIQETSSDTLTAEYWHPFPYLLLQYQPGKKSQLVFSLARRVTRPTYPQLNPWINVIDQMTYESGNKHLQPEISDRYELKYLTAGNASRFAGTIWHNRLKNHITQVTTITNERTLLVTFVNAQRLRKTGLDGDLVYDVSKRTTLNTTLSLFHSAATGVFPDSTATYSGLSWSGAAKLMLRPDKNTLVQVSGNYQSKQTLPQFDLGRIYSMDISIRRNFPTTRLSMTLSVTDLFNTRDWFIFTENSLFLLENHSKSISRIVWIGISWSMKNYKPLPTTPQREVEGERVLIRTGQ